MPHIAEGTIRDNVVFGQEFNEAKGECPLV